MNPPPNLPGSSSMPPSNPPGGGGSQGMPPSNYPAGGSQGVPPPSYPGGGGSQGVPPMSTPPVKGGGLFTTRNIIIGLVVLLFLCCCCGLAAVIVANRLQAGASSVLGDCGTLVPDQSRIACVGQDFMTKLKAADWPGAYSICAPALQKELGSAAALGKRITDGNVQPVSWTFSDIGIVTAASVDAQIDGTATFSGGRSGTLRLVVDRAGTGWQVSGFNLQPK